ncbi:MAG: DUF2188 domain-containing protein [Phycisphaerales bacterium]
MTRDAVHVLPRRGQWAVQSEDTTRADSLHETQDAAIDRAQEIASNRKVELVIHGRDGQIRDKRSFGNDPYPPRDRTP